MKKTIALAGALSLGLCCVSAVNSNTEQIFIETAAVEESTETSTTTTVPETSETSKVQVTSTPPDVLNIMIHGDVVEKRTATISVIDSVTGEPVDNVKMRFNMSHEAINYEWNTSDVNPYFVDEFDCHIYNIGGYSYYAIVDELPDGYSLPYREYIGYNNHFTGKRTSENMEIIIELDPINAGTTTTLTDSEDEPEIAGDANCDSSVNIADATQIVQYIANGDKYPLSRQGYKNADCYNTGDGVTGADAIAIQMLETNNISELPIMEGDI